MKHLFICLILLITFFHNLFSQDKPFPFSAKLITINGDTINSSDLNCDGKSVIIYIWNTRCSPCIKMLDNIRDNFEDWNQKTDSKFIAIVVQDRGKKTTEFIKNKKWPFEIYYEPEYHLFKQLSKCAKQFNLGPEADKNYTSYAFSTIFLFSKDWIMKDMLVGTKQKLKDGIIVPENRDSIKANMFEVDLNYYYEKFAKNNN